MTVQFSTTVRNAMLDALESTGIGTSAKIAIRTGTQPASCAAADSGDLLALFSLASDWMANAASGSKSINNTPVSSTATGAGIAGHYRVYSSDGVTCHMQGSITITAGGGDMTVDNTSIQVGQTVRITGFTITQGGA